MSGIQRKGPCFGWHHVSMEVIGEGVHLHIQEANPYPGLRFHWKLDTVTNDREHKFYVKGAVFDDLEEAIEHWKTTKRRKRVRL